MFLHNSLNMLTADTNDALMILIRDMERDRGGHFLFHEHQPRLHSIVIVAANINVEIVLVEAVKDNLYAAYETISMQNLHIKGIAYSAP